MGFARAADVPVVLLGDIDRGGVIASLVGTKAVIDPADAAMIVGFIVNRFRGDPSLFDDGMKIDRPPHRLAGFGPGAVLRRGASTAGGRRGGPSGPNGRRRRGQACASSCWPIRASPISTISIRCAWSPASISSFVRASPSPCRATPRWSSCRARSRPSPISPRLRDVGWDVDLQAHLRRGGSRPGHLRRLPDAGPQHRRSARHRGTARRKSKVSACSTSIRCWRATRCWSRSRARRSASGVPFKGYEMHVGRTTGSVQPLLKLGNGKHRRRGERRRPGRRLLHPRAAGRRPPAPALAAARRRGRPRPSPTSPRSTRRSICWPTTSKSTSIATCCSSWPANRECARDDLRAEHGLAYRDARRLCRRQPDLHPAGALCRRASP